MSARHSKPSTVLTVALAGWLCLVGAASAEPIRYVDGSFGFALTLPEGTVIGRIKRPSGEAAVEVAQFTLPGGNTVGRIVIGDLPEDLAFDSAVKKVREQFVQECEIPPEQIIRRNVAAGGNAKRSACFEAWDERNQIHNGVLVVEGPTEQIFILYVATRKTKQQKASQIFLKLARAFEVLIRQQDDQIVQTALQRGLQCIYGIKKPSEDLLWREQYLLVQFGTRPVGFFRISEKFEKKDRKDGLTTTVEKWLFWPAGTAEYELQKSFVSWDLKEEEWFDRTETALERPGTAPALKKTEQRILRIGRSLVIQSAAKDKKGRPINRIVECPRAFWPMAWQWLLPRLLANDTAGMSLPDGWIALVCYSPVRQGLETQMLRREQYGQTNRVLQREGMYGQVQVWKFDAAGKLRQIDASGLRLLPSSRSEVMRLFATKIAMWRQKFAKPAAKRPR